jgi:serine protease AprX
MAKKSRLPRRPRGQVTLPARLDEATLRRLVFQTFGRARRTQDSPIVPDVWLRYIRVAEDAARARIEGRKLPDTALVLDLLLTPWTGTTPGYVAQQLRARLAPADRRRARIAQSTSRVVSGLDFPTLVSVVVPLTGWWQRLDSELRDFQTVSGWVRDSISKKRSVSRAMSDAGSNVEFYRYAALIGFIDRLMNADSADELEKLGSLARRLGPPAGEEDAERQDARRRVGVREPDPGMHEVEVLMQGYQHAIRARAGTPSATRRAEEARPGAGDVKGIYLINLNRPATQSLFESRMTVKADAAQRVFAISTEGIAFAVIDCGIDATHPAFLKRSDPDAETYIKGRDKIAKDDLEDRSRVVETYDFTILRDIIASAGDSQFAPESNREVIKRLTADRKHATAFAHLKLRNENARDLDWEIVRPLIQIPHKENGYAGPGADHGTHVAGILAANMPEPSDLKRPLIGMCPSLLLYDLRVFDAEGNGDEFSILCAIEFVGWLNRDRANPVVHGVNLSLALAHDVDSFACGQTPICEVCNHLVGAGTVVVAAAGNTGFEGSAGKQSLGTGYRPISITDPGNADRVITVGSTHRRDPHAYGVSYFSGRGPTGDGRRKPDILAPGEKVTSTIRDGRSQRMDGTSMAAPHVSGAAALLMARYPELIGHPLRIKEILMRSATDLGREPSFQGAGLLDILRALESV